ncbi:MAG: hypothetical protein JNL18_21015 [Planctomycetaceae bacterium]|nr:hypothetical protein [Planctomycetaceae bacterium]
MKFFSNTYERHLRLIESNYGRDAGWYVERDGVRLAAMTACRWEEMFWDSYLVEPLSDDPDFNQRLLSDFWEGNDWVGVKFVNREFPETIAANAFPGARPFVEPGRILARGLYCGTTKRRPWDNVVLWWRRLQKGK